jgi:hypothetical protein
MGTLIIISLFLLATPLLIVVRVLKVWNRTIRQYWYNPFENDVFRNKFVPPIDVVTDKQEIDRILKAF